jgi:hypothetical protein
LDAPIQVPNYALEAINQTVRWLKYPDNPSINTPFKDRPATKGCRGDPESSIRAN